MIIKTKAYYEPETHICLFSPQAYFQENHNQEKYLVEGRKLSFTSPLIVELQFSYNDHSNLPFMLTDHLYHGGPSRGI